MIKPVIMLMSLIILLSCSSNIKNVAPRQTEQPSGQQAKVYENRVIGVYSTKLLDKSKSRLRNIDLAIEEINKVVLQPGEVFSFNKTVGPRTKARGFQRALMLIKKEKVLGYGGGICQVSTTLYNGALGAGLEITERHEHENEIGYVELGDDATVSYPDLDLKIRNNKEYPVRFRMGVGENTVDVTILTVL